ncbi:MAG: S-adenosylmethionine decarboxylase [Actinomyces sp.]|uniref:S-adenosylmethionine decarboxylase family protein n=1 Tax=Actinomyces sp. TaxID=29317 RepID=UPI0026DBA826|nr:S-adenosylmethionine decarboxylase [Actinomyces sp.]MDO4242989.1 S-adenosylmethionine decarboxylase [Actinomyces sp.]
MQSGGIWSVTWRVEGAAPAQLDDPSAIASFLDATACLSGLTAVASVEHRFEPQGVSAVLVLSESHVAIHSWPETGTAYITLTSCREIGAGTIEAVGDLARSTLGASAVSHAAVEL